MPAAPSHLGVWGLRFGVWVFQSCSPTPTPYTLLQGSRFGVLVRRRRPVVVLRGLTCRAEPPRSVFGAQVCCRVNMAHTRQSRPDSGLGFPGVPSSPENGFCPSAPSHLGDYFWGFRVEPLSSRVWELGLRVWGFGFRATCGRAPLGGWVWGCELEIWGLGFGAQLGEGHLLSRRLG